MIVLLFSVRFVHKDGWDPAGLIDPLVCGSYARRAKCVVCFLIVHYEL